jgi:hypothetical protein
MKPGRTLTKNIANAAPNQTIPYLIAIFPFLTKFQTIPNQIIEYINNAMTSE